MFDWGYCEFIMWQTYNDRMREAEAVLFCKR
jgi:hypothetical protein